MVPEQKSKGDQVLTEHLQDQFVAWFVGVMAVVYLVEYIHENQTKKHGNRNNHLQKQTGKG
jgi:hypothetical protein